jgi:hypothetical protein
MTPPSGPGVTIRTGPIAATASGEQCLWRATGSRPRAVDMRALDRVSAGRRRRRSAGGERPAERRSLRRYVRPERHMRDAPAVLAAWVMGRAFWAIQVSRGCARSADLARWVAGRRH